MCVQSLNEMVKRNFAHIRDRAETFFAMRDQLEGEKWAEILADGLILIAKHIFKGKLF